MERIETVRKDLAKDKQPLKESNAGKLSIASPQSIEISVESKQILLKMLNYIILINVWRNTQLGQIILNEKKITLDPNIKTQIAEQNNNVIEHLNELECTIVKMFNNIKSSEDLDETELNHIISKIDNSLLINTLNNIASNNRQATPALPLELFVDNDYNLNHAKCLMRKHIIEHHRQLFEQYDTAIINENSPNHSAQRASYNIQLKLQALLNLSPEELERECGSLITIKIQSGQFPQLSKEAIQNCPAFKDGEGIQELITTIIGHEIGIAGSVPGWHKNDKYFGETLRRVARYNVDSENKQKSLDELFLRNPFQPIFIDFDNNELDNRNVDQKKQSLIAVMLIMTAWYEGKDNPLGKYYADTLDCCDLNNPTTRTQYNTRFGHLEQMDEVRKLAEHMIFDLRPSQEVIDDIINKLNRIIESINHDMWSFRESRAANELKLLARHFCKPNKKNHFKVSDNAARFDANKEIFDYKMNDEQSAHIIRLYLMQELNNKFSQYHTEASQRSGVTTAVAKDQDFWRLESSVNYLYNSPLHKLRHDYASLHDSSEIIDNLSILERLIRKKIGGILDSASGQGFAGKVRYQTAKYIHKIFHDVDSSELSDNHLALQHNPLESNDNCSFNVLAARLLAILNAYCNTEYAKESNLTLNDGPIGQYQYAMQLAEFTASLYLQNNKNNEAKKIELKRHIQKTAEDIKGIWLLGSPNSRLRLSLLELCDANLIQAHLDGKKESLPFNTDKSMKMFTDGDTDTAKKFIHNHVIAEVCDHFKKFQQKKVEGIWSDKPGYFQERAVADILKALHEFARLSFAQQQEFIDYLSAQISDQLKRDYQANICDVIRKIISTHVAPCGNLANCYKLPPVINTFLNVCDTLNKYDRASAITDIEQMLLFPSQVSRCIGNIDPHQNYFESDGDLSVKPKKILPYMGLLANIHILCLFYNGNELGTQYAKRLNVPQNNTSSSRLEFADELLSFANQLYFMNCQSEDDKKRMMKLALTKINEIISRIKNTGLSESAFDNELIFLVDKYGMGTGLGINCEYKIGERRYKSDGDFLKVSQFAEIQAEDFLQMHFINSTAQQYTNLKDRLNISNNVPYAEYESIIQTEKNLDEIYRLSYEERRQRIRQLQSEEDRAPKNIIDLIKSVKSIKIPYDYMSNNSYLRKCAVNPAEGNVRNYFNGLLQPVTVEQVEIRNSPLLIPAK